MSRKSWSAFGVAAIVVIGVGVIHSGRSIADSPVIQERRALMKDMGKQMGIINDFLEKGVGDAAAVKAAADTIHSNAPKAPASPTMSGKPAPSRRSGRISTISSWLRPNWVNCRRPHPLSRAQARRRQSAKPSRTWAKTVAAAAIKPSGRSSTDGPPFPNRERRAGLAHGLARPWAGPCLRYRHSAVALFSTSGLRARQ
jgi:hypothetical protein